MILKKIYSATNIKHGESTKPLKVALLINDNVILPVYRLIQGLIEFVKPKKYIWIIKTVMWLFNLNLVATSDCVSTVLLFFLGKK